MNNKDIFFIYGVIFAGIFLLALTVLFLPLAGIEGRIMGICFLSGGGVMIVTMPLAIRKLKERHPK